MISAAILWAGTPEGDTISDSIFKNNTSRKIEHAYEQRKRVFFKLGTKRTSFTVIILPNGDSTEVLAESLLTAVIDSYKYRESSASELIEASIICTTYYRDFTTLETTYECKQARLSHIFVLVDDFISIL